MEGSDMGLFGKLLFLTALIGFLVAAGTGSYGGRAVHVAKVILTSSNHVNPVPFQDISSGHISEGGRFGGLGLLRVSNRGFAKTGGYPEPFPFLLRSLRRGPEGGPRGG